ncbi:hypothetical protein SAMN05421684_2414 [Asanoa ishikariensis]|uniref:Uncharacterized protein n=1 Tax=Asanoa ishikariensis TaxID=137265 RepID=A0A1H3NXK6_9ACTN|nr:hypothetical protein SAMN05421684_2414 [Asanoa ishikariensis]
MPTMGRHASLGIAAERISPERVTTRGYPPSDQALTIHELPW